MHTVHLHDRGQQLESKNPAATDLSPFQHGYGEVCPIASGAAPSNRVSDSGLAECHPIELGGNGTLLARPSVLDNSFMIVQQQQQISS